MVFTPTFIYACDIAVMAEPVTFMRKLFLLRHAKSSWADPGTEDYDRPLNGRGRRAARTMAEYLARTHFRPALALVSASLRTRATWEILEHVMEGTPVSFEEGIYEASRADLMHRLQKVDDHLGSVLMIGHSPGLPRLAETLCEGRGELEVLARLAEKFPTCALAEIELELEHWGELQAGTGRLLSFTRPKDLGGEDD